ncbi:MAG: DNA protecting protein DprA [Epulopiscium sp. Nele67-Bin005]|nr:MAG: DNA protecting protein DprA [Epulopiscium sp. Nele67-Bin005]
MSERLKISLYKHFGSCEAIFEGAILQYEEAGLNYKQADKLFKYKEQLDKAKKINEFIEKNNIDIIEINDPLYPETLKQIDDPPILLYGKGDKNHLRKQYISVVGSRKCSDYGFRITKKLCIDLVEVGFGICSGMAEGIDSYAHKAALSVGGSTIAVFGNGIDICYPVKNKEIYDSIIFGKGYMLSEFAPSTPTYNYNFPKRNRIISGLSVGVLVTEAALGSGTLITANRAEDQNKQIFAVPGNIDSKMSQGTNALIKDGATLVSSIDDIFEELPYYVKKQLKTIKEDKSEDVRKLLDKNEVMVYDGLSWQPTDKEEIINKLEISIGEIDMALLTLTMKSFIDRLPANRYIKLK